MAGLDTGWEIFENVLMFTTFAGSNWLMSLTILFGSMAIITRNFSDWKTLALPIIIGWNSVGFFMPKPMMILAAILFVIDSIGIKEINSAIGGSRKVWTGIKDRGLPRSLKRREYSEYQRLMEDSNKNKWKREIEKLKDQTFMESIKKGERKLKKEAYKQYSSTDPKWIKLIKEEREKKKLNQEKENKRYITRWENE